MRAMNSLVTSIEKPPVPTRIENPSPGLDVNQQRRAHAARRMEKLLPLPAKPGVLQKLGQLARGVLTPATIKSEKVPYAIDGNAENMATIWLERGTAANNQRVWLNELRDNSGDNVLSRFLSRFVRRPEIIAVAKNGDVSPDWSRPPIHYEITQSLAEQNTFVGGVMDRLWQIEGVDRSQLVAKIILMPQPTAQQEAYLVGQAA